MKVRALIEPRIGLRAARGRPRDLLAAVVIIWAAAGLGLGGLILWAAGIGHAVLGALFVSALVVSRQ